MADINIPFDFNPVSVAFKTSSYSIPAANYARVTVTNFEDDFTIDAVTVIGKRNHSGTTNIDAVGVKFTNTTDHVLVGSMSNDGAPSRLLIGINGSTTRAAFNPYTGTVMSDLAGGVTIPIYLNPNDIIYCSQADSGRDVWWTLAPISNIPSCIFWVPSDTDLDGSGYQVELFNNIT